MSIVDVVLSDKMKRRIDAMTREEMAAKWRFDPIGDPMFQGETGKYFRDRFWALGGFSVAISKSIGLER